MATPSRGARLEVEGVSAAYGTTPVLHDIDLDVPEGQLLCVLGPSGGGKSTLLRVVAGLEEPVRGSVQLDGRDLAGVPAHERGVGLMFQDYALFPHRDVGQNVAFGLRMHGRERRAIDARVHELLALVGLPGAERRAVTQLSGGEQQRVALARALAPSPRLLMLDEPMGSLDRALRERLPEELRAIFAELGLTVLYVTHDQDEALTVADRVVLLDAGRLVADGTPEELWTHPPDAWTARFLGFRNIAPGYVRGDVVETPWGRLPLFASGGAGAGTTEPRAGAGSSEPGPGRGADVTGAGRGMADADDGAAGRPPSGPVTVVLRPAGLVGAAEGPIRGRVSARRFRGDHIQLSVEVADAPTLQVEAREDDLPAVGDVITLAVTRGGMHLIEERAAVPSAHERADDSRPPGRRRSGAPADPLRR